MADRDSDVKTSTRLSDDRHPDAQPDAAAEPQEAAGRRDRAKGARRQALSARAVHYALLREGEEELQRPWTGLGWSGFASGLSIGASLLAEAVLRERLPDTTWRPLVARLGYSVGFLAVTLGRQQLFTETTLTAMLPLLHHRDRPTAHLVLRFWTVVLFANLVGCATFAAAVAYSGAFDADAHRTFREIGLEAMRHGSRVAFAKGIFAGWLIALMVWLLPSAESARFWVVVVITWLLAAAELTHVIAGSVDGFYLVFTGELAMADYVITFLGPTFLGNTIGGTVFVAALNHAQVGAEE